MKRRAFLAQLAALPLAGCGFQLRGTHAIPYRSIYVHSTKDSATARELTDALRNQGVVIADSVNTADATLKLAQEKRSRTILSLSGAGRVKEYRLNYSVNYSLTGKDGKEIYPDSSIQSSQDFTYDDNQYLAKAAEEDFLYRDLQNNAVQQILRRLATPR